MPLPLVLGIGLWFMSPHGNTTSNTHCSLVWGPLTEINRSSRMQRKTYQVCSRLSPRRTNKYLFRCEKIIYRTFLFLIFHLSIISSLVPGSRVMDALHLRQAITCQQPLELDISFGCLPQNGHGFIFAI